MTHLLVNKTMSRNGGTLILQLLEGHGAIFFPRFMFDLATKEPRCWPLSGFTAISQADFYRKMIEKVSFWEGSSWFEAQNFPISEDNRIDREILRAAAEANVRFAELIEPDSLERAFFGFIEGLVGAYGGESSQTLKQSDHFVIDADHSFSCGVAEASENFRNIRFLQVIRNVSDVVASRKNMLMHHAGLFGDPRDFTLHDKVVRSEVSRWLLSILATLRDQDIAPRQCVTLQFESLHLRREDVMRQVAKFLEIEFRPSLLVEGNTGLEAMANQNSQFVSSSSLLRVTKGLSSTVIGSSLETLTKAETEVIANVFDGAPVDWPTADDIPEFQNFLENFVYRHREAIRKNSFLQKVKSAHTAEERMSLYSELNFGRANVDQAFVR